MAHNNNRVYDVVIRQRRYRTRRLWALLIFHINDVYAFTIYMLHYIEFYEIISEAILWLKYKIWYRYVTTWIEK